MNILNNASDLYKLSQFTKVFDVWTYQKIVSRYGGELPKHGVTFEKPVKRRKGRHIEIDSYGMGDVHDVQHTSGFSSSLSPKGNPKKNWNIPIPKLSNLLKVIEAIKYGNAESFTLGANSDPFQWMDRKYKVTHEILLQLTDLARYRARLGNKITVLINTRSDLIATDTYLELIKNLKEHANVEIRIFRPTVKGQPITEHATRLLEPGAPSLKRRELALNALRALKINAYYFGDEVYMSRSVTHATGLVSEPQLKGLCSDYNHGMPVMPLSFEVA